MEELEGGNRADTNTSFHLVFEFRWLLLLLPLTNYWLLTKQRETVRFGPDDILN